MLDQILANVERVVPHDSSSIMLLQDSVARVVRSRGFEERGVGRLMAALQFRISEMPGMRHMTATGQPLTIPDTRAEPDWISISEFYWTVSYVGAPLGLKGQVIGFINLDSATPNFYTQVQADRLQAFADQAAVAIENARLFDQVQQAAAELERRVKERTSEIESARNRLQAVLDAAGDGIYFTDTHHVIQYMNPALERLTGYTRAEVLGKTGRLWRSGLTPPLVLEELERQLMQGQDWQGELINRRKDGTLFEAALTITPLRDPDGTLQGFVTLQRDITHLKELTRLKDQFVSRIGHELRTPLANLGIYLGLLEHGNPNKRAGYLTTFQQEVIRVHHLVEGFLTIAALDANTNLAVRNPTNLNSLIGNLAMAWRTTAAQRRLTLEARLAPGQVVIPSDAGRLTDVLTRVLDNALNYTPPGGQITITLEPYAEDNAYQEVISVCDTGPGFSVEDLTHLFERFYRGSAARNYKTPGAGLGLAICRAIVEQLGGQITIANSPTGGAVVTIRLKA